MFNLVEKRRWFFLFSAMLIVPGILAMIYSTMTTKDHSPFRLSIDFVGGSVYEVKFTAAGATESGIREVFAAYGEGGNLTIQRIGDEAEYRWSIRGDFHEDTQAILNDLADLAPLDRDYGYTETVSATVGREVARAAVVAVIVASLVITGFIVWAFRQVPKAARYGVCAVVAMIHDVFVVMGFASIMGLLRGWEIDALFLTALLTVVGYSVQDTIVMFDRIRENIPKHLGEPFETIVNRSIWETIHRSLATQLNAVFVMIAILLFGGETIKQFIAILCIGLLSGTYSSIFNAVPLLVAWEKGEIPFLKGDLVLASAEAEE